jgi:class 3 adenylate cyclase
MNAEIDVRDVLPSVRVPTLVLDRPGTKGDDAAHRGGGAIGSDTPHVRYVADRIPGARYVVLPGEGGGLLGNEPEVFPLLKSFFDEAASHPAHAEQERVLATVLFTDIVDSTIRAVELGDRRWAELVAAHHERVRRELARHRGRELDTAGDGFFASFDGPARAIRCACAIRDAVGDLGLEIRAGLHTGECEQLDGKVAGIAVVTGARIAALGEAGDVLVSATVRDLVAGSGLAFEDRGDHELKGLPEARRLYAVV